MEGGSTGRAAAKINARLAAQVRGQLRGAAPAMSKTIAEFSRAFLSSDGTMPLPNGNAAVI